MKRLLIAGNWKMNKTIAETESFVKELVEKLPKTKNEVLICPTFLSLQKSKELTQGTPIKVGAQNMHFDENGPYTGEVGAEMLKEVGVEYVIIGHSSRRTFDNDTDEKINKKLKKAISSGLVPILCVGETKKERDAERTYRVLKKQIIRDFEGIESPENVIIAYEPLWAISDGINPAPVPTTEEIATVNSGIRRVLRQLYSPELVKKVKILYGGSVGPDNASEIMGERSVSGVLVGGASLKIDKFIGIIESVNK